MSQLDEFFNKLNKTLSKISKFFGLKDKADMSDAEFFGNSIPFFFILMIIILFIKLIASLLGII